MSLWKHAWFLFRKMIIQWFNGGTHKKYSFRVESRICFYFFALWPSQRGLFRLLTGIQIWCIISYITSIIIMNVFRWTMHLVIKNVDIFDQTGTNLLQWFKNKTSSTSWKFHWFTLWKLKFCKIYSTHFILTFLNRIGVIFQKIWCHFDLDCNQMVRLWLFKGWCQINSYLSNLFPSFFWLVQASFTHTFNQNFTLLALTWSEVYPIHWNQKQTTKNRIFLFFIELKLHLFKIL